MAFALFIGGLFLGSILGFVVMALLAVKGDRCHCEEVQIIGSGYACAYPPSPRVSPSLKHKPQAFGA